MAEFVFPYDDSASYEDRWQKMGRFWSGDGVLFGYLNMLEPIGDASGMNIKVKSGACWGAGTYYETDAQKTVTIGAAHASLNRYDIVVVRFDRTANTAVVAVIAGTPGGSPTGPGGVAALLTNSTTLREVPLALVRVAPAVSSIAANRVLDMRHVVPPSGVLIGAHARNSSATGAGDVTWTQVLWDLTQGGSPSIVGFGTANLTAPFPGVWDVVGLVNTGSALSFEIQKVFSAASSGEVYNNGMPPFVLFSPTSPAAGGYIYASGQFWLDRGDSLQLNQSGTTAEANLYMTYRGHPGYVLYL